jgi:outer membrane protein assembly factor BamD
VRRRALGAALLAAGWLAAGCATTSVPGAVLPADEEYSRGVAAYQEESWGRAAEHLNRLVLNYPADERIVEARYLLGQANFHLEEYPSAAQDFERFQSDFPADTLADDALWWAGRSYEEQSLKPQLDQADTRRAISSLESLLSQYPSSAFAEEARERIAVLRDRLAEKEFLTLQYYYDQQLWKAAEIYARSLIEEFPQSDHVAPAYLMLLRAYEAQGLEEDARRVREALLEQFPESPEAAQLRQLARPEGVSLQAGNVR